MELHKVVIAPDSFKGTMSAQTVCGLLANVVRRRFPACEVVALPLADGGEGTADCFLTACGGERVTARVSGPFGEPMEAAYARLPDGTAVIEVAACAGLPLVEGCADPLRATTYGVGQLLLDAAACGCKRVLLGLGGSCTNDAGAGMAAACGVRFYDENGTAFVPTGGTLCRVCRLDMSGLSASLSGVDIIAMCDVDNPLYGERGAAAVFAPQKGADAAAVRVLDDGLRQIAAVIARDIGMPVDTLSGGGAAGGLGAGVAAFFGARLQSGIDTVLAQTRFEQRAADADVVFTGEGRFDSQSLGGKAVGGIAARAAAIGVPVVVIAGSVSPDADAAYQRGVTAVFGIDRRGEAFADSRRHCEDDLARTAEDVLRLIAAF